MTTYVLGYKLASGAVLPIELEVSRGAVRVHLHEAGVDYLDLANSPDTNPPTGVPVLLLADGSTLLPLSMALGTFTPAVLGLASGLPAYSFPRVVDAVGGLVKVSSPEIGHATLARAPAVLGATTTVLAPTLAQGSKVVAPASLSMGSSSSSFAIPPSSPGVTPGTVGATAALPATTFRPGPLAKPQGVQAAAVVPLAPAMASAVTRTPQRVGCQSGLPVPVFQLLGVGQLPAVSLASSVHAFARTFEPREVAVPVVATSASARTPSSASNGPAPTLGLVAGAGAGLPLPTFPRSALVPALAVLSSTCAPLAFTLTKVGARGTPALGGAAATLAPTLALVGARTPNVGAIALAPLAPSVARAILVGPPVGIASSVLTPAGATGPRTIAVAVVSCDSQAPIATWSGPIEFLELELVELEARALEPATSPASTTSRQFGTLQIGSGAPASTPYAALPVGGAVATFPSVVVLVADFRVERSMSQPETVQHNSIGLVLLVPMLEESGAPLDLTGASQVEVWLEPPNSLAKRRVGIVHGSPTMGVLRYVTVAGDLHALGLWRIQGRALWPSGRDVWAAPQLMRVAENLGPNPTTTPEPVPPSAQANVLAPSLVFS